MKSENPAETMRSMAQQMVGRPLTDEENSRFDELARYCNEPVNMPLGGGRIIYAPCVVTGVLPDGSIVTKPFRDDAS